MKTNLIGKEEKNEENLLEKALNNRLIKRVLEGVIEYDINKTSHLRLESCPKSKEILQNIEKHIGFKDFGAKVRLVKNGLNGQHDSETLYSKNNILLCLLYLATERSDDSFEEYEYSNKIHQGINDNIGFGKTFSLHKDQPQGKKYLAFPNICFALYQHYVGLGMESDYLFKYIHTYFKFDEKTGLIKKSITSDETTIEDSLLLSLYYLQTSKREDAKKLMINVENYSDFDKNGLIRNKQLCLGYESLANALLSMVYFGFGRNKEALKVIDSIEEYPILKHETGLVSDYLNDFGQSNIHSGPNAALALAYMAREAHK
jgi:hypothetical protein